MLFLARSARKFLPWGSECYRHAWKVANITKIPPKCVLKTKGTSPEINLAPFQGCRVYRVSSTIQQKNQTAAFLQEGPALHTTEAFLSWWFVDISLKTSSECLCVAAAERRFILSCSQFIIKKISFASRTCMKLNRTVIYNRSKLLLAKKAVFEPHQVQPQIPVFLPVLCFQEWTAQMVM